MAVSSQPLINIGAAINDNTGELGPRTWLQKINRLPNPDNTVNPLSGDYGGTYEAKLTAAVADAFLTGKKYCWVTQSYNAALVTFNTAVRMIREGGDPSVYDIFAYGGAITDGPTSGTPAAIAMLAAIAVSGGGALWGDSKTETRIAGGVTYTTGWDLSGVGSSGLRGILINRSAQGLPVGVILEDGGTKIWDTIAIDATSHDLVLAYSYVRSADILRIDEQAHLNISDTAGAPDATMRLRLESTAADTAGTATMLRLDVAAGSPINAAGKILMQANVAAAIKMQLTKDGFLALGLGAYAGTLTNGALEVSKGAVLLATDADPVLWLAVRGTNTRDWLLRVSNANSRQIEIVENNTGLRPLIIRPSSLDAAIFMDGANGGLTLGVAASKLGFYGHAVIALQTLAANASDLATAITLVNDIKAKLIAVGLTA